MKKQIPIDVLNVLKAAEIDGNALVIRQQLDRSQYQAVNKVLEMLGGKWDRKAKAHIFDEDAGERVMQAVMAGEVTDWKKLYQFFPTPMALARTMVQRAGIEAGNSVLEPSAGDGAILRSIRQLPEAPTLRLTAVEINSKRTSLPMLAQKVHYGDFLACNGELGGPFDRIVMNPPFRNGQDIAHVQHAFRMLKPGGRLVAITAPGWEFREERKYQDFRAWIEDLPTTVEDLPEGTFSESGTDVRTKLLTICNPL